MESRRQTGCPRRVGGGCGWGARAAGGVLLAGAVGLSVPAWGAAPATFEARTDFATGSQPRGVAVADFNGDGRSDVVTANAGASTVTFLAGAGNGRLGGRLDTLLTPTRVPVALAPGDFDRDGRMDVVVVGSGFVSVMRGDGAGRFPNQREVPAGAAYTEVAVGDFNSDGKLDVVVAGAGVSTTLLLGDGAGFFSSVVPLSTHGPSLSVAVADVSGDGHLDVITADEGGWVSFVPGRGDGNFYATKTYDVGSGASTVSLGDANGDGRRDLLVGGQGTVFALPGDGNGEFWTPVPSTGVGAPADLVAADFNADGFADVAVSDSGASSLTVLSGTGAGTVGSPVVLATGSQPRSVAVGDFNGDGKPDLVVVNAGSNTASVFLNSAPRFADVAVSLQATPRLGLLNPYIEYTVGVTNHGPDALSSSTVRSLLPAGLNATSATCVPTPGAAFCEFGALAPGASASQTFRVPLGLLSIGLPYVVTATRAESAPTDTNPFNDSASRSCTVITWLLVLCN